MKQAANIILIGICAILPFDMGGMLYFTPEYFYYAMFLLVTLICFYFLNWFRKEKQLFKAIKRGKLGVGFAFVVILGNLLMQPFFNYGFQTFNFILVAFSIVMAIINFGFVVDKVNASLSTPLSATKKSDE